MGFKAKICVFLFLAAFMCGARAEYYMVYPAPACVSCTHPHWVTHHYNHHRYPVRHHHTHHCYHRYGTEIYYYSWVPVPACGTCAYAAPSGCGACGHHRLRYDDYFGYYYDDSNANYDPDLATGDDDQMADPNMDIDH